MNFFTWIREGVRQAVLMGVSDAVETIGEPAENAGFREELSLAIEQGGAEAALPGKRPQRKTTKRLGRSLKDVEPVGKQA
ncbi:MAG: hypothetical protein KDB14_05300 [Planctomycetales bacterium]|nr:hypothetical protein [Planctomycetales bacterium]